ncbi:MAG: sulfotransferase, partial [Burkholderiales bacterium]|nr:sulfotransferase [Burkholderiales bacterium]
MNPGSLAARTIDLNLDALLAEARRATGLEDFGDPEFMPHLARLTEAWRDEARLNAFGRQVAHARTLGSLKNRLWAQACWRAEPVAIATQRIAAPIVIVGPHRSGTTRLQRMLACDARLAHLRTWEGMNPAPRALPIDSRDIAQRRAEAEAALAMRHARYPSSYAMHAMHADWPEEEMLLLNHSFCSFSAAGLYDIPGWYRWFTECDKTASYVQLRRWLQLIGHTRGDAPERRWLLKNPQHMLDLPALMAVFPDARLVFIHRDPQKTVGSTLSMMTHFAAAHTDHDCRDSIRNTWLDFCERSARRCADARAAIAPAQQLDVHYAAMNQDWR